MRVASAGHKRGRGYSRSSAAFVSACVPRLTEQQYRVLALIIEGLLQADR